MFDRAESVNVHTKDKNSEFLNSLEDSYKNASEGVMGKLASLLDPKISGHEELLIAVEALGVARGSIDALRAGRDAGQDAYDSLDIVNAAVKSYTGEPSVYYNGPQRWDDQVSQRIAMLSDDLAQISDEREGQPSVPIISESLSKREDNVKAEPKPVPIVYKGSPASADDLQNLKNFMDQKYGHNKKK